MGVGDSVRALKQVAKGEMLVGMDAPWIGLNLASMCILSTDASLGYPRWTLLHVIHTRCRLFDFTVCTLKVIMP